MAIWFLSSSIEKHKTKQKNVSLHSKYTNIKILQHYSYLFWPALDMPLKHTHLCESRWAKNCPVMGSVAHTWPPIALQARSVYINRCFFCTRCTYSLHTVHTKRKPQSITKKGIINARQGYVLCKIRKKSINERTSRSAE